MSPTSNPLRGENVPDDELLRIVRTDDDPARRRAAATELVRRYRNAVYLWCFRYTHDRERALDLSQDVLTTVWQKIGSFEGRSRFSSWLFSVTRNRCIDATRQVGPAIDDIDEMDLQDPSPLPDALLEQRDDEGLLRILRAELERDEQEAIWLHYIERVPIDEVKDIMGLENASGARGVLQRARRKLRAARDRDGRS